LSDSRAAAVAERQVHRDQGRATLQHQVGTSELRTADLPLPPDGVKRSFAEWAAVLEGPAFDRLAASESSLVSIPSAILAELVEDARYAPYIARHDAELRALAANEAILLDPALDYSAIGGLSNEMVERFTAARPETLGQASRINGVTPAALTAIMVHSRRRSAA
jgi:tRNA uridine 5-carboxymethylaminomethyl modification enzyme